MRKAIFIDKDGTLIPDIPYNASPEKITLQEYAISGLKQLQAKGFLLVIISNQSGVARGYFAESELQKVSEKIEALLQNHGINLDGFYYCPHHKTANLTQYAVDCDCRKPKPGMFYRAATEMNIDLTESWMTGDILNDVEAGNKAGCRTVLIDNGNETEWEIGEDRSPDYVAATINDAADFILEHEYKLVTNE